MATKQTVLITDSDLVDLVKQAVNSAFKEHQEKAKPDNTILSQTQAADLLQTSIPTLNKWKDKGLIPFSQIGRKIYFKKSDVLNSISVLTNNKQKG